MLSLGEDAARARAPGHARHQLKREAVVDAEAFSAGAFKSHGGYARVDKDLGGKLAQVLDAFGDGIWEDAA